MIDGKISILSNVYSHSTSQNPSNSELKNVCVTGYNSFEVNFDENQINTWVTKANTNPIIFHDRPDFGMRNIIKVDMQDIAISNKDILITYGADPCVIMAVYNVFTHTAALTHISAEVDINTLLPCLQKIAENKPHALTIYLAGGNGAGKSDAAYVINLVEQSNYCYTLYSKVSEEQGQLGIDPVTGHLFDFAPTAFLKTYENLFKNTDTYTLGLYDESQRTFYPPDEKFKTFFNT